MTELHQLLLITSLILIVVCGVLVHRHCQRKAVLKERTKLTLDRNHDEAMLHRWKGADEPVNYYKL